MRRKRRDAVKRAHKELKAHKNYRRGLGNHIQRVLEPRGISQGREEVIALRKNALKQLMDSRWARPRNLQEALAATRNNTLGEVHVVGNHPKHNQKSRSIAFKYLDSYESGEKKGSRARNVVNILEHGKVNRQNAHVFLTALEGHGFFRTKQFMDREGVDSGNILKELKDYERKKRLGDTQKIELPKQ